MSPVSSFHRAWYAALLAGLLPVLVLGFVYSALADRTAFVIWALTVAAAWTLVLHQGMSRMPEEVGRPALAGVLLLLLALGFAGFAWLEGRHHETLDLGFRAVLPGLYHPVLTAPATAGALAGVLAAAGLAAALTASVLRRREMP